MRELKFRAWNKMALRYEYFTLQDLETKNNIQWHILEIEQFTGMQDCDGVDIYENDRVETIEVRGDSIEEDTAIIKMDGYMWIAVQEKYCDSYLCCYAPSPHNESEIKVIGNIHEKKGD